MVFISYSTHDYDTAKYIRTVLSNNGVECWMAPESIPMGSDYSSEIPDAIENCSCFLLVLSSSAQKSNWVPKELDLAITHSKTIIPFQINDEMLTKPFNFRLTNVQRIEAFHDKEHAYNALLVRLRAQTLSVRKGDEEYKWISLKQSAEGKYHQLELTMHRFYTDSHQDVIITASGFPCYYPRQIQECVSKGTPFLLAKPVGTRIDDSSAFSDTDYVTDSFITFITENSLQDQLERARNDVFESFLNKAHGNQFNGNLFGISNIDGFVKSTDAKEEAILQIDFYKTDYYTHKIIEQMMSSVSFSSDMLKNSKFSWMRTSFVVSVILIIPKQNEIILTKKTENASYKDGKEWIYVSVTETLSETDYDELTGCPDLRNCVSRGISEELGIADRELKTDTLRFYETFYETHFHQDNIVASIELSDELTFSDIYSPLVKDRYLEIEYILTILKVV